mgnify:CR=1 FL=1
MRFKTINPSNNTVIKEYEEYSIEKIQVILERSNKIYCEWKNTSFDYRAKLMKSAGEILRNRKEEFGRLMATEMGKPLAQGIAEAEKCAWVCDYYAENAERHLSDIDIKTEMRKSYVSFQPIGTILAIMPWNFPFWQVFRFAAPALMAGNAGVLKHSRNTMGCGVKIEEIFLEAGFPEGLFTNLVIGSDPVESIIKNPLISAVTLTGSTPVGSIVAGLAGKYIKKTVMELGGSDPYVILEDAELAKTAETCVVGRMINSGQSCIAAKRFIVVENILDEFEQLVVHYAKQYKFGDPMQPDVNIGPMARKDLQLELHNQVVQSIVKGCKCLLGGYLPETDGYYYPPTVLSDVRKGTAAYDEETFGPVATIIPAKDEKEAIAIANDTIFGLGAAVFTRDIEKGEHIAKYDLQAGCCFVNAFVKSDPRLPFGGIKQSGYGRELSEFGIKEFMNIKTVCIS